MAAHVERKPDTFPKETIKEMPAEEHKMKMKPKCDNPCYKGSGKLQGKVALITGGDSGIGKSVAIHYAREGANVCIVYLNEHKDAEDTKQLVQKEGVECLVIAGDVCNSQFCRQAVEKTVNTFHRLDILVNNAGVQHAVEKVEDISYEQFDRTMKTNVYGYFYMVKAALPHLQKGSAIINTTSVNAYKGHKTLIDYSATKGAERSFTISLAKDLASRGIRVNAVAPGPIWTPFIPPAFPPEKVEKFGQQTELGRAGQPEEVAPCYVFLASENDSSYITGETLHPNGGHIVGV